MNKELLNLMTLLWPNWLINAISKIKPELDMTNEARAGILALMTRLGEVDSCTLEQIPIFLKGLDKETV